MFITTSHCEGAGNCVQECPTQAIRFIDNKAFSCITCGICFENCPNNAIFNNKYGGYVVDRAKCNGCGVCQYNCPVSSIHIEEGIVKGICLRCGLCKEACPVHSRIDGFKLVGVKQAQFLDNLNTTLKKFNNDSNSSNTIDISKLTKNISNSNEIIRNSLITDFNECVLCGRCSYYCPTNAIIVKTDQNDVCTKCGICIDNCPTEAISQEFIDQEKCILCLNCLKNCPNNAVIEDDFKVTIKKLNQNITGSIVSCLNCGLCNDLDENHSLNQFNGKIQFDPSSYEKGSLYKSIKNCPVSTLKLNKNKDNQIIPIKGYCVSCGNCVKFCKYDARKFEEVKWDGNVSKDCISCGICCEVCPKDAITLNRGCITVDTYKCILCESCGIYCPKDAIPKSTSLKKVVSNGFNLIDQKLCVNCKLCYKTCPEEAIMDKNEDGVLIDEDKCIYCGACKNVCPSKAFIFEREFTVK